MKRIVVKIDTGKEEVDDQIVKQLKKMIDDWLHDFFGVKYSIE